jgi:ATP phosphoribosyltransferase regulatory subunit
MMLRPDFTVPVVQMHMSDGAEPARYAYLGEVFRKQEHRGTRAAEYLQAGFEVFDRHDPAAADASLFCLFARLLAPLGLRAVTGDIGILRAAVEGLDTTQVRKTALMRHIWRPARFRALLDRYAGRAPAPEGRADLLARLATTPPEALIAAAGPLTGLRDADDIAARCRALADDAATPPLPDADLALIETLLGLRGPASDMAARLRALSADRPALAATTDRFVARLDALAAGGIDPAALEFEASFGRTTLEYYDGFVFGFVAPDRSDLPPVATGGRYDALTAVLGAGRSIPAVGGVIRPGVVATLGGGLAEC